jgi:hypothetical protein
MTRRRIELSSRFVSWRGALQIPPLRYASVGMTKLSVGCFYKVWLVDERKAGRSTALRSSRDDKAEGGASLKIRLLFEGLRRQARRKL